MAAAGDADLGVWSVTDPAHPARIKVNADLAPSDITAVTFSPDGRHLAYGGIGLFSTESALCLLDLFSQEPSQQFPDCTTTVFPTYTVAYTPDGAILTGGQDGAVRLWRSLLPRAADAFPADRTTMAYSRNGRLMAAEINTDPSQVRSVGIWDIATPVGPTLDATLTLSARPRMVGFVGANGLLTVAEDGAVRLWNLRDPHHPTPAASLGTVAFPTDLDGTIVNTGVTISATDSLITASPPTATSSPPPAERTACRARG